MTVLPEQGENPLLKKNFRSNATRTPQHGVEVERKWKRADYTLPGSTKQLVQIELQNARRMQTVVE
jgi:formate dehydrogenase major subunit